MKWKDMHELQDHWQTFLQILSNQGGPTRDAANHLATRLSDKLEIELKDDISQSKGIRNVKTIQRS